MRIVILASVLFLCSLTSANGKRATKKSTPQYNMHQKMMIQMNSVARDFASFKSLSDLINSGNKKQKLMRRKIFSGVPSGLLPPIFQMGPAIFIYVDGKKKAPDIFSGQVINGKPNYYYNGKNVTRRKGETIDKWLSRLTFSKKGKKKKKTSFFDWILFSKAYAEDYPYFEMNPILNSYNGEYSARDGDNNQLWRERLMRYMATSTDDSEWETQMFDGSNNPFSGSAVELMKNDQLLRCDNQKHAYSSFWANDADGISHSFVVESYYDFSAKVVRLKVHKGTEGGAFDPNQPELGRLAVRADESGATNGVYYACGSACSGELAPQSTSYSPGAVQNLGQIFQGSGTFMGNEMKHVGAALEALGAYGAGCCGNAVCRDAQFGGEPVPILPRGQAPSSSSR